QGDTTKWLQIAIVPASFALFRSGPTGPAIAQQITNTGVLQTNGLASSALAGQVVVLWGAGLGSTDAAKIGVTLGGVAQTVLYAGRAPSLQGVDQINFRIADSTPD